MRDQPPAPAQACVVPPYVVPLRLAPPCADALARPRTLRDSPRMVCGLSSPGSPPRSATAPLRVPASSLRSEPRLLTARTLRGSVPPRLQIALSPPRLFSCAAASARPRTLRDSPRVVCGLSSPGSTPRAATAPLSRPGVLPPLRTPVTDCPHAPRLRPSPPASRALSPLLRFR